jgi:hypothetical protein
MDRVLEVGGGAIADLVRGGRCWTRVVGDGVELGNPGNWADELGDGLG